MASSISLQSQGPMYFPRNQRTMKSMHRKHTTIISFQNSLCEHVKKGTIMAKQISTSTHGHPSPYSRAFLAIDIAKVFLCL